MEESDIEKKRTQARLAMSAGHKPGAPFSVSTTLPSTTDTSTTVTEEEISKKREEARKAMEGNERRKKREEEQKLEQESLARLTEIENIKIKRVAIEQKLAAEKKDDENSIKKTQEENEDAYREKVSEAKTEINKIKNDLDHPVPFHSLTTDIQNTGNRETISLAAEALADREKQLQREKLAGQNAKKSFWLSGAIWLMAVVFVGGSLVVLSYALILKKKEAAGVALNQHRALFYTEETRAVKIDTKTPSQIKTAIVIAGRPIATANSLTDIYFTRTKKIEDQEITEPLTATDFLAVTNASFTPDFTFFLTGDFMTAVYTKSLADKSYVYVFKTRSFEHSLDALLQDDKNMTIALYDGLILETTKLKIAANNFRDETIANIDSHTLRDETGQMLMMYAFLDRSTLVIAQNEDAFQKVLEAVTHTTTSGL